MHVVVGGVGILHAAVCLDVSCVIITRWTWHRGLISVCVHGRGCFLPVAVEPTSAAKPTSPFVCNGCLPRFFAANADGTCALEFLKEAAPVPRFLRYVVGKPGLVIRGREYRMTVDAHASRFQYG